MERVSQAHGEVAGARSWFFCPTIRKIHRVGARANGDGSHDGGWTVSTPSGGAGRTAQRRCGYSGFRVGVTPRYTSLKV